MLVSELLTEALEELNIVAAGVTPPADVMDYAFRRLNRLLDLMAIQGLAIPYPQTRTTFTIVSGTQDYTVGTGGTINRPRPQWIDAMKFYVTAGSPIVELDMGKPLTDQQYRDIPSKAMQSTYPQLAYYNPTYGSTGFATLSVWPVPNVSTLTGVLYAPSALPQFAALSDTVSVPPGYWEFFVTQIAFRLAPGFKVDPPPALLALMAKAESAVNAVNLRQSDLQGDAASLTGDRGWIWSAVVGP